MIENEFVENEGYRAQCDGKDLELHNPYAYKKEPKSYWKWRQGFSSAVRDSRGINTPIINHVDLSETTTTNDGSTKQDTKSLGYLLRVAAGMIPEMTAGDLDPPPAPPMKRAEREAIIRSLENEISTLTSSLRTNRCLLDEEAYKHTESICIAMKKAGRSGDAIKYYRDQHKTSLSASKLEVERMSID